MKFYIISGETSGDQHAAQLIDHIKSVEPASSVFGMGGDESIAAGMQAIIHQKEMAFMGFWEVLKNLGKVRRSLKRIKSDIASIKPDVVILVDYPGFNLRIAKYCYELGIDVYYYIAPKVWAWKENRVKKLAKYTKHVFSILPFEEDYFKGHNVSCTYVGNPSKVKVDQFLKNKTLEKTDLIALLPGSRDQEIKTALPIMLKLKQNYPNFNFVVAQAPGFNVSYYAEIDKDIEVNPNMYDILSRSKLAVVTSGTATLETALFSVPQVVCYSTSKLTYWIAKSLIKIKYISLVNLILDKPAIKELIQDEFNSKDLKIEVDELMHDEARIKAMNSDYRELRNKLKDINPPTLILNHILKHKNL